MLVKILGCATSTGVPVVGCDCDVCTSDNPRNKRTRSSLLIQTKGKNILIDSSTDLRFQALEYDIKRIDAVLYTHSHADHTHGIDDLRTFNFINDMEIPCFANEETVNNLKNNFSYIFDDFPAFGGKPRLNLIPINGTFQFENIEIEPVEILHAQWLINGYKIGTMAYLTDCSGIPDSSIKKLENLDLLIIGALRYKPHKAHFNVDEAVDMVNELNPKLAIFTHMSDKLDYDQLNNELPEHIEPAYDGQEFELPDT